MLKSQLIFIIVGITIGVGGQFFIQLLWPDTILFSDTQTITYSEKSFLTDVIELDNSGRLTVVGSFLDGFSDSPGYTVILGEGYFHIGTSTNPVIAKMAKFKTLGPIFQLGDSGLVGTDDGRIFKLTLYEIKDEDIGTQFTFTINEQ